MKEAKKKKERGRGKGKGETQRGLPDKWDKKLGKRGERWDVQTSAWVGNSASERNKVTEGILKSDGRGKGKSVNRK